MNPSSSTLFLAPSAAAHSLLSKIAATTHAAAAAATPCYFPVDSTEEYLPFLLALSLPPLRLPCQYRRLCTHLQAFFKSGPVADWKEILSGLRVTQKTAS
uniref:Uncharacterized protein n=1 Tax=Brugia malayi TaxID=6279 RepID=A8QBQ5_BRUMA